MDTPHKETYEFLKNHTCGVLSTASKEGKPWGAAIYYAADEQLRIYFLTHKGSRKFENIDEHPQAALTVVDNDAQTTVQAAGTVELVPIGNEHDEAYRMLVQIHPPGEYRWVPPVSKLHDGEIMLCRFTPQHLQLSTFDPDKSKADVHKII
ncbi:MAG TPA: pyridoxamine 5'-phosphate oxidase family protein [Candidatus Saccharimonadales bacterium]|nr:pyridoxamine 5'-phosphate oxidase family protein [Candidatus Saccharimonadales bacterium]